MKHRKCSAILLLRLLVGVVFIYYGLPKLIGATPEMAGFVGSTFHSLGLTFLSNSQWLTFLGVVEVAGGLAIILGFLSLFASIGLMIIMLGAMYAKNWGMSAIEKDIMIFVMLLCIAIGGDGRYALSSCCCKKSCKNNCKTA